MNQQAERRVGTIIGGKWRVDTLLGSGSMAAVYAVTHRNGARSALKILHPTLCTDPAVCERFLGEGYLANSVKHNGIVRVLDDGVTDDGCVFLVMELLEGETLEEFRQRRGNRLPIPEALELGDKLMDVLSAVHAAGIIHRDLKPQNVFVCHDGTLKLLDFGVARVFDRTSQSKLSMFGLVLGTPSFMSPEQALGSRDKVDHRSDIWSLGATLFTALTGETVHLGANIQAKLLAAATVKARSISMVMPDLPAPIAGAIDMALRFKKEDRWQSVDAMRRALREARSSFGFEAPAKPALYDMSLDEVTHVDKPAFDGAATIPNGPPLPRKAPGGTFIGMQSPFAGTPAQASPVATAAPQAAPRPPMKSIPPPLPMRPHAGSAPAIDPLALVPHRARIATSPDGLRASRPDGQEGSIPAYGSTLKVDADRTGGDIDLPSIGIRRRGSVGVWLAAVALAAAALGGIAFFAVKRSPVPPKSVGSVAPPPVSIEAPTFTPPPQPTMQLVVPEDSLPATSDSSEGERIEIDAPSPSEEDEAPAPKPARAHHRTHRTHRAAPKPEEVPEIPPDIHFDDPPEPKPTATAPPEKTAEPLPPGLAPDPFGTPE